MDAPSAAVVAPPNPQAHFNNDTTTTTTGSSSSSEKLLQDSSYNSQGTENGELNLESIVAKSLQGSGQEKFSSSSSQGNVVMGYPVLYTVVGSQYCLPYAATFKLERTIPHLFGADWTITDVTAGNVVFKVIGRLASVHAKMDLVDAATGMSLVHMKRKILNLHNTWHMYLGQNCDKLLCDVKKTTIVDNSWPSMDVFLASSNMSMDFAKPNFHVEGKYYEEHVMINCDQQPIAEVWRKGINVSNAVRGRDIFEMTVFPGGDHAFAAALVIIMDVIYIESKRHASAAAVAAAIAII